MNEPPSSQSGVRGERATAAVARAPTLRSRAGSVAAFAVVSALGLGSLAWYYGHAMTRASRERQSAQAAAVGRANAEMPLPALGRIDVPGAAVPGVAVAGAAAAEATTAGRPAVWDSPAGGMPVAQTLAELPLTPAQPPDVPAAGIGSGRSSPARLALERQLSGTVFVAPSLQAAAPSAAAEAGGAPAAAGPATHAADGADLTALLRPGARPAAAAGMLPTQRLLLPKGAFIDCTLETAIDSTLPGMTTCVTATDTFGVDGRVVLLERGTKLVGETRGGVSQGAARLFVLWTEARTPAGVIVPLDSPGADALGRAGLGGTVNRHFWQRFGAAMLVSVLDGAVQAAASSRSAGGGTVVMNPSASAGVITEVLRDTINIPPTIILRNGERIQVLVARDLDFRSVYALRPVGGGG